LLQQQFVHERCLTMVGRADCHSGQCLTDSCRPENRTRLNGSDSADHVTRDVTNADPPDPDRLPSCRSRVSAVAHADPNDTTHRRVGSVGLAGTNMGFVQGHDAAKVQPWCQLNQLISDPP
jgi:hypothetical protein